MNDEYLLSKGYKSYPATRFDSDLTVLRFQKRFDDDTGKKYFINVLKNSWDFMDESRRGRWWKPFTYTYEIQITMFEGKKPINLEFFSDWTLEEVEQYMEKLFKCMNHNYYEKWDEC